MAYALVLVDVVNHFELPDGKPILRRACNIAPQLTRLKERARGSGIPTIYVNDNFGQWWSEMSKLLAYCLRPEAAHDARMRGFDLIVPSDCCTARSLREHHQALEHISEMAGAKVVPSASLRLRRK